MTRIRSHLTTLTILLAFALVLIALDQSSRLDVPQNVGGRLTMPVESLLAQMTSGADGLFGAFGDVEALRQQNQDMRRQLDELTLVNVQRVELQQENERLRELLGFKQENPNFTLLVAQIVAVDEPARIIGRDVGSLVRGVRINQGRESGIEPGMSVITARGLVGQVVESGDRWSKVLLVTDESSHITALIQESRASGVVDGTGTGVVMRLIPHEQRVEPGDVVLTAGLGGHFPRGLVIGVVESVRRSDINPWQEAVVRSTIEFDELEYVFVIRSFSGTSGNPAE